MCLRGVLYTLRRQVASTRHYPIASSTRHFRCRRRRGVLLLMSSIPPSRRTRHPPGFRQRASGARATLARRPAYYLYYGVIKYPISSNTDSRRRLIGGARAAFGVDVWSLYGYGDRRSVRCIRATMMIAAASRAYCYSVIIQVNTSSGISWRDSEAPGASRRSPVLRSRSPMPRLSVSGNIQHDDSANRHRDSVRASKRLVSMVHHARPASSITSPEALVPRCHQISPSRPTIGFDARFAASGCAAASGVSRSDARLGAFEDAAIDECLVAGVEISHHQPTASITRIRDSVAFPKAGALDACSVYAACAGLMRVVSCFLWSSKTPSSNPDIQSSRQRRRGLYCAIRYAASQGIRYY
ncbi:hypothetical protein AAG906_030641 [Vitis piasezkii]